MIDLANRSFVILGLRGSGKSVMTHHIAGTYGEKCLLYDTLDEYPMNAKYHTYTPTVRGDTVELATIARAVMTGHKYRMFIIEEANRYCVPKPVPLPQAIADLNDWHRHYNLSVGYVARRPVQLNQDIVELAEYIILFNLKGRNDIKWCDDLSGGLGDAMLTLKPYHFIIIDRNRNYQIYQPIPFDGSLKSSGKSVQ